MPDAFAGHKGGVQVEDSAVFHVDNSVAGQLTEVDYPADRVDCLALSHFHPDHVGNVGLFRSARLLVQRDEYEAAFGSDPGRFGYVPDSYAALRDNPVELLQGDHDVFGDGSVVIKRLPGHTPGSQSLLVRLPKTGSILISGDVTHSTDNWQNGTVPALNVDAAESERSLRIAARPLETENVELWIQHDHERNGLRKTVTEYYT